MESLKKLKADFQTLSKVNPMLIMPFLPVMVHLDRIATIVVLIMSAGWAVENRDL